MPDPTKQKIRTFQIELDSLPVQLVPPDPGSNPRKTRPAARPNPEDASARPERERQVLDRLIDRIKKI